MYEVKIVMLLVTRLNFNCAQPSNWFVEVFVVVVATLGSNLDSESKLSSDESQSGL